MPKLIDHAERRDDLADATWRVIMRDGITGVSIRTVAAEAGLSTGSLRHVFPSKVDLLVYAMQLVNIRVTARVTAIMAEADAGDRGRVRAALLEFLPLDPGRRAEMEVNVALFAEAHVEAIREVRDESAEKLRRACRHFLQRLGTNGPEGELDDSAAALHALVDGLALHLLIDDSPSARKRTERILDAHLNADVRG
ncbi:TetR/AcrR family transcriptional regulator [Okibacterium fritillariae]|uniref:Transcriptional regulator, TetR family n=1 Tax=Okibacterium fritillariae TaxID=123320 RepID=A0A1T5ICD8_9MICO|nr:TetR/AcrR family transcriptional regulator [Okibacterium fritillariae]SKC36864.1 transcriptional regulator, TetR family [Okibacterium fritillariae]